MTCARLTRPDPDVVVSSTSGLPNIPPHAFLYFALFPINDVIVVLVSRETLRRFNVNLSEDEFYQMMTQFERDHGDVSYTDFIKSHLQPA